MHTVTRSRRGRSMTFAVAGVTALLTLAGCGKAAENIAERGLEEAIEREGGGDVDIDLGGGGFNLETDEGSIRVGEDGSFVIEGEDGQVITGDADDEGFNFQSEDGENVFRSDTDIPDEWPSDVPRPDGLSDIQSTYTANDGIVQFVVVGDTGGSATDYLAAYAASLEGLGYERTSYFEGDGRVQYSFDNSMYNVTLFSNDNIDSTVTIGLSPLNQ